VPRRLFHWSWEANNGVPTCFRALGSPKTSPFGPLERPGAPAPRPPCLAEVLGPRAPRTGFPTSERGWGPGPQTRVLITLCQVAKGLGHRPRPVDFLVRREVHPGGREGRVPSLLGVPDAPFKA